MENPTTTRSSILRNSLILGLFAMATVGMIAITQQGTAERISEAQRRVQLSALNEIIPHDQHDNDLLADSFTIDDRQYLSLTSTQDAYRARNDGAVSAVILPVVAPDGYSGRIELLVGINADGSIAGVRSVNHRETPGLGDRIDTTKSQWVLDFNGKSLSMPIPEQWAVKKDGGQFDQFAGATITPRAVVKAVYQALNYFDEHRASLLQLGEE
ncbi:electron transport complex subunit G [Halopseudomonas oceani]|uniref:Ion-translocating oxidoreductase complex subunit G n=1 Tax=Halopseudomonas oceani TaxID=1708783 RepID=A0A2P4EV05_9GAMM|nr:electron transport complex subunit RsxG [Halopseudomonas oceani]POB03420.1 electron transport complex subunit RsxG [Halopseudomonas oceani]GGE44241.1 electron transport complex subunit G [Halopseudomonas oceani]